MDGHFVPNITLGPPIVASLRKHTKLPLDCHLMIENPDEFIPAFADAGANWVSVHYEACRHLHRTLELIAQHGMEPAVVINPATAEELLIPVLGMVHHVLVMSVNPGFGGQKFIPYSLKKIRRLRELRQELGLRLPDRGGRRGGSRHRCEHCGSGCGAAGGGECGVWRGACGAGCPAAAGSGAKGDLADGVSEGRESGEGNRRRPLPGRNGYRIDAQGPRLFEVL